MIKNLYLLKKSKYTDMLAVILNQHLIKKERAGRMQKPRIPPHPTTKQEILFLRRMGFPAQKKMKKKKANW